MNKERKLKNSIAVTYELLRCIHDGHAVLESSLRSLISKIYSSNHATILNHLKILRNSGFVDVITVEKLKVYCFKRIRGVEK